MEQAEKDEKFKLYRIKGDDIIHVAIPVEYISVIETQTTEHGEIKKIPSDKTVRGIFLQDNNGELEFDEHDQQNDIVINQLIES